MTWRDPGRSGRVLGVGLYAALCVSSLRDLRVPLSTAACTGVIALLAASLAYRVLRGLRAGLRLGGGRKREGRSFEASRGRRAREASARRVAAKLGGWVAASAAARAPLAAEAWLALERCVSWEHPPTTLGACFGAWLVSLVARVWCIPPVPSFCVFWVGAFTVPPVVRALRPTVGPALARRWRDATTRGAHVLNDRRMQLGAVGTIWACTGFAGRIVLVLSLFTLFVSSTRGSEGGEAKEGAGGGDDRGGETTRRGNVTITELPASPPQKVKETATRRSDAVVVDDELFEDRGMSALEVTPPTVVKASRARRRSASTKDTSEDENVSPRHHGVAGATARREKVRDASSPARGKRAGGADSPRDVLARRGNAMSSARQRIIADRARRLMRDSDDD